MDTADIAQYARALYEAHGDKAEAEAAQRAQAADAAGDADKAESWNKVRAAIRQLRGPNQG